MRLLAAGVQTVQCKVGRKVNNVMRERKREREQWREKERERERKTKRERKRETERERERYCSPVRIGSLVLATKC
jgi:hypothetical protein